jgi:tripartite-type tricarboxylate transporter receptor subunit TctC
MRIFRTGLLMISLASLGELPVHAEGYPAHYITVIVPAGAGAPPDTIMRIIADPMSRELGQQIVVENVPGSGGITAARRAASASPDGYTMLVASSGTHAGAPALYADLGFDPVESFEQVGLMALTYVLLIGRRELPANNLPEFIAYLQANEKTVTEGNGGVGSISHVACTYFHSLIKINPTRVPYRATSDITVALLGNNIDYLCNQYSNIGEQVRAGRVKAFAVSSEHRLAQLPDVPTAAEAGLPGFKVNAWFALQVPKGTPRAIVTMLNRALDKALDDPNVQRRMLDLGIEPAPKEKRAAEWLAPFITSEIAFWHPLLSGLGVQQ